MKNSLIILVCFLSALASFGQSGRKFVREGNKLYEEKRFHDADSLYRYALKKDSTSYKAGFNLGDALYKQGKYSEASNYFEPIAKNNPDPNLRAQAYHNLGNCLLESKKYEESINAYKNALKLNPKDEDTRYNLAYAQKMLQKQQEQKKNDDKKDDKKDDKNKDKDKDKKSDKGDDNKDQKKNPSDNQNKDQKNDPQQNSNPQQLSKEDAQRLLNALNNDEKKVQEKLKKKNAKGVKTKVEKDW